MVVSRMPRHKWSDATPTTNPSSAPATITRAPAATRWFTLDAGLERSKGSACAGPSRPKAGLSRGRIGPREGGTTSPMRGPTHVNPGKDEQRGYRKQRDRQVVGVRVVVRIEVGEDRIAHDVRLPAQWPPDGHDHNRR